MKQFFFIISLLCTSLRCNQCYLEFEWNKTSKENLTESFLNKMQSLFNIATIIEIKTKCVTLDDTIAKADTNKKILFLFDNTAYENTTIRENLATIKNYNVTNALIIIKNLRKFLYQENNFPTIPELKQLILNINPTYQFYAYGDTALAFLPEDNVTPSPLIKIMTTMYLLEDFPAITPNTTQQELSEFLKAQNNIGLFHSVEEKLIIQK